jgi:DNA-binding NarL/FixJ family response regulator
MLSQRQRQVALLAQRGCGDKEIAYALGISRSTVAGHLSSAMHKLGVHSRIELGALPI